jgi:glycosyltransferase involved in cell wall biosynthesis
MKIHRLAVVASHVIQYQDPFFKLLAAAPDIDLTVLFCSSAGSTEYRDTDMQTTLRWNLPMLEGYRYAFLRNLGSGEGIGRLINPGLIPAILFGHYDAVAFFVGWGTVSSILGIAACRSSGTPIFMFGDSDHPPPEITVKQRMRAGLLRGLLRVVDGYLVSGILNGDYYEHYGASRSRFFDVPWAIDNDRFIRDSSFAPTDRETFRNELGVGHDQLAIIFSGKLIPRKDPLTILRAMESMRNRKRIAAIILGHGELREEVERFAREHQLTVHFAGFVNQTELPRYYGAGDVFVLASTSEPRGTVVNEAMACRLPLVVTNVYGGVGDIARDGDNALLFSPGDVSKLAEHLDHLVEDPALRAHMANRSRDIIDDWSYARGVEGIRKALSVLC